VHAEAAACRNNLKKYASILVKSDESIFGGPQESQPNRDTQEAASQPSRDTQESQPNSDDDRDGPPEEMWSAIQQRIADLLDEGKYLNGPLDPAVSL
jgi:hypothetical protein